MVRALEDEREMYKSRLDYIRGMHGEGGRQKSRSMTFESDGSTAQTDDDRMTTSRSHGSLMLHDHEQMEHQKTDKIKSRLANNGSSTNMELMKERFSKLLLGEDMSGGGKGVSSALALSNAITNLAASVFGEQKRLEPMAADTKARWRKEIDWLLSVTDHIVEFVPSKQRSKDGTNMEIMVTRQRNDLHMNIPALRKLDAMLLECLDNFKDQNEFYYVSKDDEDSSKKGKNNGRASLGDSMYKSITDEYFDPDYFLSTVDLSSEHKILDLKNKIEASVVIWKRKMNAKDNKSAWGSAVSLEKREIFEDRAETILLILKHRFPGLPQSDLDISKIQCNRDVGHAILESYSRIIESLAFTVLSRIDDVMQVDSQAQNPMTAGEPMMKSPIREASPITTPKEENNSAETPTSMTLLDFMGWNLDKSENETKKDSSHEEADRKLRVQRAYGGKGRTIFRVGFHSFTERRSRKIDCSLHLRPSSPTSCCRAGAAASSSSSPDDVSPVVHKEAGPSEANPLSRRSITDPKQTPMKQVNPIASLQKILKFRLMLDAENDDGKGSQSDKPP
ncbi:Rop guanine nucleotide exchange factor [Striga asiatica]|uniref:Rop guanine nucleotide exchange factor n=1 Tax=Striga asiatica TaxID=4170 RepID=A0A5A7QM55_STRAF|nr:Rop guanine nucleotide exchange factor [Striga asiatica]